MSETTPTLSALAEAWQADLVLAGKSPRTIRGYTSDVRLYWTPKLGTRQVDTITARDLRDIAESIRERAGARSTLRHVTSICSLFRFAVRRGYITHDASPTRHLSVDLVKVPQAEPQAFTREQLATLQEFAKRCPIESATIGLFYGSGLRRSEMAALTRDSLDGARLYIRGAYHGRGELARTKSGRDRVVDLSLDAMAAFQVLAAAAKAPGYYLFPGRFPDRPCHPSTLSERVARLIRDSGLPNVLHTHSLRHTFATVLLETGSPPAYVASVLGDSLQILERYYWTRMHTPQPDRVAALDAWRRHDVIQAAPSGRHRQDRRDAG